MNSKNFHITVEEGQNDSSSRPSNLKMQVKYSYQKNKDQKPRRNKSAFIIFSGEARASIKAVEGELNSNEMMVKLAERWKNLQSDERAKYDMLAKNDKVRYQQELVDYNKFHPNEALHNKTKHNHVKKPCSAYGIFLKERKNAIKIEQPDLKMAAVLKIVSEEWKSLTETEKKTYQEQAFVEKEAKKNELCEAFLKDQNTKENVSLSKVKNKKEKETKKNKNKKVKTESTKIEVKEEKYEKLEESIKLEHTPTPTLQTLSSGTISSGHPSEIWSRPGEMIFPTYTKTEDSNVQIKAEATSMQEENPLMQLYRHSSSLELMMNAGIFKKSSEHLKDSVILSQFTKPAQRSNDVLAEILKMDMNFEMPSIFDSNSFLSKLKSESSHSISKFFDFTTAAGMNKNALSKIETPNDMLKNLLESEKNGNSRFEAPSRGKVLNETITSLLGNNKNPSLRMEDFGFDKMNSDIFK